MPNRPRNMSDAQMLSWLETQYDLNDSGCWVWRGRKFYTGYGKVNWKGKQVSPHRLYWLLSGRTIPEGLVMCHGFGCVRACYNPEHLRVDTESANGIDRFRDGTGCNKLTVEQVLAIRTDTRLQREIAEEYGVIKTTISNIKTGRTWGWL